MKFSRININRTGKNKLFSVFAAVLLISALTPSGWIFSEKKAYETVVPVGVTSSNMSYLKRFRPLESFEFVHIIPLEAIIGRLYLGLKDTLIVSSYTDSVKPGIQLGETPAIQDISPHIIPMHMELSGLQKGKTIKIYRVSQDSIFGIDLYQVKSKEGIGNYRYGDTLTGSITMGYSFGKKSLEDTAPVNLFLGVSSIYSTPERKNQIEVLGTDYGTVFFVPGLQISRKSVVVEAMLELPVYRINPDNAIYHQQDLKANIGMKYIIE